MNPSGQSIFSEEERYYSRSPFLASLAEWIIQCVAFTPQDIEVGVADGVGSQAVDATEALIKVIVAFAAQSENILLRMK